MRNHYQGQTKQSFVRNKHRVFGMTRNIPFRFLWKFRLSFFGPLFCPQIFLQDVQNECFGGFCSNMNWKSQGAKMNARELSSSLRWYLHIYTCIMYIYTYMYIAMYICIYCGYLLSHSGVNTHKIWSSFCLSSLLAVTTAVFMFLCLI